MTGPSRSLIRPLVYRKFPELVNVDPMANIKISIRQTGVSTSKALLRDHRVLIDRPTAKGGNDLGPMGGELFLASVGGCFMSNLLAAAKAREAEISGIETIATGTLTEAPVRFASVELEVTAVCSDGELLAKLVEIAERGCIMVNTLRGGVDLTVKVNSGAA